MNAKGENGFMEQSRGCSGPYSKNAGIVIFRSGGRGSSCFSAGLWALPSPCVDTRGLLLAAGVRVFHSLGIDGLSRDPDLGQSPREKCPLGPSTAPQAWTRLIKAGLGSGPGLCPFGSRKHWSCVFPWGRWSSLVMTHEIGHSWALKAVLPAGSWGEGLTSPDKLARCLAHLSIP